MDRLSSLDIPISGVPAAPSVQVALPALQQIRFSPPAPSAEWDNRESGALMMLAANGMRFSRGFRVTTLPQWPSARLRMLMDLAQSLSAPNPVQSSDRTTEAKRGAIARG